MVKFKSIHIVCFLILISSLLSASAIGPFKVRHYDEQHGLASNIIKRIISDKNGFMWIASDGGVVRYDGSDFLTLNQILPSTYVKDIVFDSKNRIYVVSDFGFGEIINPHALRSKIEYKPILEGSLKQGKETVFYPKSAFVDKKDNIWVSELTSITKITSEGEYEEYSFVKKYHPDSYLTSYLVRENSQGGIYAACWRGYILKFDPDINDFQEIKINGIENLTINDFEIVNDRYYLGTNSGFYEIINPDKENPVLKKIGGNYPVSAIEVIDNVHFLLGTWSDGLFSLDLEDGHIHKVKGESILRINNISRDQNDVFWIASDIGIYLLDSPVFNKIDFSEFKQLTLNPYIMKSYEYNPKTLIFTDQEKLYTIDINTRKINNFEDNTNDLIYDFTAKNEIVAVSYRDEQFAVFRKGNVRQFNFGKDRIVSTSIDSKGNVWGILEQQGIPVKIDSNGEISRYESMLKNDMFPSYLKCLDNEILLGFTANIGRLAKYSEEDDTFHLFGPEIDPGARYSLRIFDIVKKGSTYYLGTNLSLMKFTEKSVSRVGLLDNFGQPNIRAVALNKKGELWLGADRGVFLLGKDELSYFNKNDGLPGSSVTIGGLLVDENNKLWVSTLAGLAVSKQDIFGSRETPSPLIVYSLFTDNKNNELESEENTYLTGTDVAIHYASQFYPTESVVYKTMLEGYEETEHFQAKNTIIKYHNLSAGNYKFSVMARKDGYLWSKPVSIEFTIEKPWYISDFMILIYIIAGTGFIGLIVIMINARKVMGLQKKRAELQKLVNERTAELFKEKQKVEDLLSESEKKSEELARLNEFKGQLLSIAAHDLKNPLQSIIGMEDLIEYEELSKENKLSFDLIFEGASRMLNIIQQILENSISKASDLHIEKKNVNLTKLLRGVIEQNKVLATRKQQAIHCEFDNIDAFVDETWMVNVFDNLLSNAIKYSGFNTNIWVNLSKNFGKIIFFVKDEGPGFTEEDKKQIFGKFKKLSARPTANESSTGLGLYIVKEIITRHEGTIELESEQGKGSKFIITLPDNHEIADSVSFD